MEKVCPRRGLHTCRPPLLLNMNSSPIRFQFCSLYSFKQLQRFSEFDFFSFFETLGNEHPSSSGGGTESEALSSSTRSCQETCSS